MDTRHLYVHVPFCARRCSYCDFAIAVRRRVPASEFVAAISREIDLRLPGGAPAGSLETLYLGGGTPSRLGPEGVARLIDAILGRFGLSSGAEVTIEANPEDVDAASAAAWKRAGVTRISLGVQSFDDRALRWMHRTHDATRALAAVHALRDAGFEDWSLDLIFALPREVERSWSRDLDQALALDPPHVSCYGLTVEPHTPLRRWRERGVVHEADEERYEADFLEAHRRLTAAGLIHYEVSNYALPGRTARHNAAYWRRVPYLGFGPSAHSFDGNERRWNEREYAAWLSRVEAGEDPVGGREQLPAAAVELEEAYLGLRTSSGVPVQPGTGLLFRQWSDHGWATVVDGVGMLTPAGWLRLDALAGALTSVRSRY